MSSASSVAGRVCKPEPLFDWGKAEGNPSHKQEVIQRRNSVGQKMIEEIITKEQMVDEATGTVHRRRRHVVMEKDMSPSRRGLTKAKTMGLVKRQPSVESSEEAHEGAPQEMTVPPEPISSDFLFSQPSAENCVIETDVSEEPHLPPAPPPVCAPVNEHERKVRCDIRTFLKQEHVEGQSKITEAEINQLLRVLLQRLSSPSPVETRFLDLQLIRDVCEHLNHLLDSTRRGHDVESVMLDTWGKVKRLIEHIETVDRAVRLLEQRGNPPLSPFGPCLDDLAEAQATNKPASNVAVRRVLHGILNCAAHDESIADDMRLVCSLPDMSQKREARKFFQAIHATRSRRRDSIFSEIDEPEEEQRQAISPKTIKRLIKTARDVVALLEDKATDGEADIALQIAELISAAKSFVILHRALRKLAKCRGQPAELEEALPEYMTLRVTLGRVMDLLEEDRMKSDIAADLLDVIRLAQRVPRLPELTAEARRRQLRLLVDEDDGSLYGEAPAPLRATTTTVTNVTQTTVLNDDVIDEETRTHVDVRSPKDRVSRGPERARSCSKERKEVKTIRTRVDVSTPKETSRAASPTNERISRRRHSKEVTTTRRARSKERSHSRGLVETSKVTTTVTTVETTTVDTVHGRSALSLDPLFKSDNIRADPTSLKQVHNALIPLQKTDKFDRKEVQETLKAIRRYLAGPDASLLEEVIARLEALLGLAPTHHPAGFKGVLSTEMSRTVGGVIVESVKARESRMFVWSVRPEIELFIPNEKKHFRPPK